MKRHSEEISMTGQSKINSKLQLANDKYLAAHLKDKVK